MSVTALLAMLVSAEIHVTVPDQHPLRQPALAVILQRYTSMITRRGPRTRLPDPHARVVLDGAARPIRLCQGRRDPHVAPRGCRAAPHEPSAHPDLARPRDPQRAQQAAADPAAPNAARLAPHAASLARQAHHPPLDLPAPTTRPTTHATADPGPGAPHGPRESPMGLSTDTG